MRGGDISNEIAPRVIVTVDCIIDRELRLKRVLFFSLPVEELSYNQVMLSRFWNYAHKFGFTLELVGFETTQKDMDRILNDLDNLGTNPFNYAKAFNSCADLVVTLPLRPEIKHVIDVPDRGLRYGHWYREIGSI